VVNANGTGFVRLTSHPSADFGADWSPTGRIAFATTRFGPLPELAVMNGDGSGVTRLGAGVVGEDPDWSPNGGQLAFSRDLYVYTMAADGSNEALLAFGTSPAWRPSDAPLPAVQSPVARLGTPSCVELTCTFDASGSTDDAGTQSIAYYMWTVDGIGGYSAMPTWKQSFAEAGTHTVRVTIGVYATGLTATATQSVTVTGLPVGTPPVASFTYRCTGLACTLDGRGSSDDAAVTNYSWNIGNAGETMTGAVVNAIYPSEGSRTVVLTVSDAAGQTSSTTRTLYAAPLPGDAPPVARVNVYCAELQCVIDASASSDDRSLRGIYIESGKPGSTPIWTSTLTAVYPAGTYTVTATAVDDAGQMGRATKTITVSAAPVASFTYSCVRTKCTFDARSSTDDKGIVSYTWNLGGQFAENLAGAIVTHDYKRAGTYTAMLTVRDAEGQTSSVSRILTVRK
jgi:PKD repeat protein